MRTVLLLNPMGADVAGFMTWMMKGTIAALGPVVKIAYPNVFGVANIEAGKDALNAWLVANYVPGQKITVFAYSEGGQVAAWWLNDEGPTSAVDPADMDFILIGHPTSKFGGFVYERTNFDTIGYIHGVPDDTEYTVTIGTRQYDPFADFPGNALISDALDALSPTLSADYLTAALQAVAGVLSDADAFNAAMELVAGAGLIHSWYLDVALNDINRVEYRDPDAPNINYVWWPTYPLPTLNGYTWWPAGCQKLDKAKRVSVERSWTRPVEIPTPLYTLIDSPKKSLAAGSSAAELYSGDVSRIAKAADEIAEAKDFWVKDYIVTIYDKFWRPTGEFGEDIMELSGTDPRNGLPSATLKIQGGSRHVEQLMHCKETMVGITVETGGLRFPFYVDDFDWDYQENAWTGTAKLLGIWDILNYLQIWPMWYFPIQAQPISHAVYIWGICTVIENMVAEQALRIQGGVNEFLNNALSLNPDVRAWYGALLQSNGNILTMLKTPIYVVRNNPLLDTSPLIAKTVRMESCGTVIQDITKAYGVDVRVDLWLPGDDQPDPWANLDQPTYVVIVKDRSQIEGPTKTVLDSVLRAAVDLEGSLLGKALQPLLNPQGMYAPENVFIAPTLGLNFVEPWAILVAPPDGERGSVGTCKISFHTQKGWQHIMGGRSPKWLNDLMNATYAWIIDSISILIGFSGIPSNLLEGFLNNSFLAFQLIQHYERRNEAGPYHPNIETFTPSSSSPYNIETVFDFINKLWETRGYVSAQATFPDGVVYKLGRDVFRGGLMSIVYPGPGGKKQLFTDYVENIMFRLTPTERSIMVQIGDGQAEEAPLAKHTRFITGVIESINVLTLAPQS